MKESGVGVLKIEESGSEVLCTDCTALLEILRYNDLAMDIQRMWNVKTEVVPVKMGATGTISKSFRKYLSSVPGKHEVKQLQKTAILGTAHTLRKVLT
jgi:hypothetical protein